MKYPEFRETTLTSFHSLKKTPLVSSTSTDPVFGKVAADPNDGNPSVRVRKAGGWLNVILAFVQRRKFCAATCSNLTKENENNDLIQKFTVAAERRIFFGVIGISHVEALSQMLAINIVALRARSEAAGTAFGFHPKSPIMMPNCTLSLVSMQKVSHDE